MTQPRASTRNLRAAVLALVQQHSRTHCVYFDLTAHVETPLYGIAFALQKLTLCRGFLLRKQARSACLFGCKRPTARCRYHLFAGLRLRFGYLFCPQNTKEEAKRFYLFCLLFWAIFMCKNRINSIKSIYIMF